MKLPNVVSAAGMMVDKAMPVISVDFSGAPIHPDGDKIKPFVRFFSNSGLVPPEDLNVAGPIDFTVDPIPGYIMYCTTMIWSIIGTAVTADKFGGLAMLTNGVKFQRRVAPYDEPSSDIDFFGGLPIKTNAEMMLRANLPLSTNFTGASNAVSMGLDFIKLLHSPVQVLPTHKLFLVVNDDLSTIPFFRAVVYGYRIPIAAV